MKYRLFQIKKFSARMLMALGSLFGLSACIHHSNTSPESVYGPPPPDVDPSIEIIEDVYGPPVEDIDTFISDSDTSVIIHSSPKLKK